MDTNPLSPVHEPAAPLLSGKVLRYRQNERAGPCLQSVLNRRWPRVPHTLETRLKQTAGPQRINV
jgi:hypothetical protein